MAAWKAFIFHISTAIANQLFEPKVNVETTCTEWSCKDRDGNVCGGDDGFQAVCHDGVQYIEDCTLPDCCSVTGYDLLLSDECAEMCKAEMKKIYYASEEKYTGPCSEEERTKVTDCPPGLCYIDCKEEVETECVETTGASREYGVPEYMVMQTVTPIVASAGAGIPCTVGGMLPQMCSCLDLDCTEFENVDTPAGHYFYSITDTKGNREWSLIENDQVLQADAEGGYYPVPKPEPAQLGAGGKPDQAPAFESKPAPSKPATPATISKPPAASKPALEVVSPESVEDSDDETKPPPSEYDGCSYVDGELVPGLSGDNCHIGDNELAAR